MGAETIKLRAGTMITREDVSRPYIIWCAKCDFYTTAVSARGWLMYREAVKLANKHSC
jgi:hypothetical protein